MTTTDLIFYTSYKEDSLKEVMKKICRGGERAAFIVSEDNTLRGLVTDGDIRRALINGASIEEPIEKYMNRNPVMVKTDYSADIISKILSTPGNLINILPVVNEENKLVKILFHKEMENLIQNSQQELFRRTHLSPNKKHVLITGGGGYIGSVLIKSLLEKGYRVKVLDKFIFGSEHLNEINNSNLTLLKGDTGNVENVVEAIQGVDAVIYLAEIVGDPACAIDPKKTQQINYLSTSLVARTCKHFNIDRFIYTSSCSVYGSSDNNLLDEESNLNPVSLYARMKIECEKTILGMQDEIFSPTILRLATVFGHSPRMRFDLVVNTLTGKSLNEGKLTIVGGDQWRPFVHVADVAQAITLVLESPVETVKGNTFNVGSNHNNFTINDVGRLVKEINPEAEVLIQDKDIDKRNYRVDFSKIKNTLGFNANKNVIDGIKEISDNFRRGDYPDNNSPKYSNHKTYEKMYS